MSGSAEDPLGRLDEPSDAAEGQDLRHRFSRSVRTRMRPWPYFGGLALACLALQVMTGIVMALSYQPTPDQAYVSSYYIAHVMPYGWLVRTVHSWSAQLLIGFAAVHAVRVFVSGSYKGARRAQWSVGALSLLAAIALGFTGNLLPWDQQAYWDTTAAIELFGKAPLVGEWVASALLGGDAVGASTLTRFYAAHIAILPAALLGLLAFHLWSKRKSEAPPDTAPLYPDLLVSATTTTALLLSLFAVLATLMPASLDVKADLSLVLQGAKPAWYFLSIFSLSRLVPPWIATGGTLLLGVLFILLPVIDRGPSTQPKDRVVALVIGSLVIIGVLALTVIGALL